MRLLVVSIWVALTVSSFSMAAKEDLRAVRCEIEGRIVTTVYSNGHREPSRPYPNEKLAQIAYQECLAIVAEDRD